MFPYAGAQQTYDEAKRFYELYGAGDNLKWITGPGGHGNLGPISNQILAFLVGHLKGDSSQPEFKQFRPQDADELIATPSGQISISLHSKTVEDLNRERAKGRTRTPFHFSRADPCGGSKDRGDCRAAGCTARGERNEGGTAHGLSRPDTVDSG